MTFTRLKNLTVPFNETGCFESEAGVEHRPFLCKRGKNNSREKKVFDHAKLTMLKIFIHMNGSFRHTWRVLRQQQRL